MRDQCTAKSFLENVATHKLTILKDDGLYRHLLLSRDGSSTFRFEIVTYPGHLVISGDMGANTFARLPDMFRFFRDDIITGENPSIPINLSYWHEKLQIGRDEAYEFTYEEFERVVRSHLEDIKEDTEDFDALMEDVESDVFRDGCGEQYLREALAEFEWRGKTLFHDTWEWDFREYTYHYTWQCYAIVWAIAQYDAVKDKEVQP